MHDRKSVCDAALELNDCAMLPRNGADNSKDSEVMTAPPTEAALHFLWNPSSSAALAFEHMDCPPCKRVRYAHFERGLFPALHAGWRNWLGLWLVRHTLGASGHKSLLGWPEVIAILGHSRDYFV
jgi:hypothetical protein